MVKLTENQIVEGDNGLVYRAQTVIGKKKIKENQIQHRAKMRREVVASKKRAAINPDLVDKIKHAEKFIMERRETQKNFVNQRKRKYMELTHDIENRTILAIRLRGPKNITENQKVCLKMLKLKSVHDAVVFKATPKMIKTLKICEPFITYGFPTRQTISEMIHKRAFCKIANEYKALNSNVLVEEHLGHLGCIVLEDIVTELYKSGKNLDEIRDFLGAFKMTKPTNGYGEKTKPFKSGGAYGFRDNKINDLVSTMI